MSKKTVLTFMLSLVLSFFTFEWLFQLLSQRQEEVGQEQSKIIQSDVKDRFSQFLGIPLTVGLLSADNLSSGELTSEGYGAFAKKIFDQNKQLLGLSLINELGRIVQVYPVETNSGALGKITQNYAPLMASYENGEPYWFSIPFKLYQGQIGFVFYVPVIKEKRLKGWVAAVISAKSFFNEFRAYDYFNSYELIIRDKASEVVYFGTAIGPDPGVKLFESEEIIHRRKIVFQSWRKVNALSYNIHWGWVLVGSSLLASLITLAVHLHEQRKKTSVQLQNISTLLDLTAKEALSNLVDIHSEINKLGASGSMRTLVVARDVDYITNLIEQIDLLQTMTQTGEELTKEDVPLLPLIQGQLREMAELIQKKNIKLILKQESFKNANFYCNAWMIKNSVLRHLLTHTILLAHENATITVDFKPQDRQELSIHLDSVYHDSDKEHAFKLDRRLEVTRNVMLLHEGELLLKYDPEGSLSIKLFLPRD